MATQNQGYKFRGQFPYDEDSHPIAVLGGVIEDTRSPGLTDTYVLASFNSDGKLQVDTELTLSIDNLTITNILVAATDQTGTNQRYILTDDTGKIILSDLNGIDVDLSYANDSVKVYGRENCRY